MCVDTLASWFMLAPKRPVTLIRLHLALCLRQNTRRKFARFENERLQCMVDAVLDNAKPNDEALKSPRRERWCKG